MSLAAHITVRGYHTRWFSEYLHVPHGLVIPLWSGASYEDHELFVSKLQNMGVNAVLTRLFFSREKKKEKSMVVDGMSIFFMFLLLILVN